MKNTLSLFAFFLLFSPTAFAADTPNDIEIVGRCVFPTRSPDMRPQLFPELNCHDEAAPICLSVSGCARSRIFYSIQLHRIELRLTSGKESTYEYDLCVTMEDCHRLKKQMQNMLNTVDARIQIQNTEKTRTSLTGAVFTRVTSYPELGEAWRDPSGLIWGAEIPRDSEIQNVLNLSQGEGAQYCESLNARLPTEKEFAALKSYLLSEEAPMGRWQPVIPEIELQYSFWTADTDPEDAEFAPIFIGGNWEFSRAPKVPRNAIFLHTVRCVRR